MSDALGDEECQHVYSTVIKKKKNKVTDEPNYENTNITGQGRGFYDVATRIGGDNDSF